VYLCVRGIDYSSPVPDLPLCLGVLKHRGPLARGEGHLAAKKNFTMDFCLCGAILNLKASVSERFQT